MSKEHTTSLHIGEPKENWSVGLGSGFFVVDSWDVFPHTQRDHVKSSCATYIMYVCRCVCMHACMHVCVYIYIYIHVYIYIYIHV